MQGLERLHFFNGQRLDARDLEIEQRYHIRVRRMMNHGLYSAGVVSGLEVSKVDPTHVRVTHGIALDPRGREVILLSDATMAVPNHPPSPPLQGFFLAIAYGEETEPGHLADCKVASSTTPPSKILEAPTLSWTETWPDHNRCGEKGHPGDCAVVLAMVILDNSCQIKQVEPAVREYAHSTVPGQVRPFALEGEKDIDRDNPKKLHFQVRGGLPSTALLFLWGDALSSLLYTELGQHSHDVGGVGMGATASDLGNHTHPVNGSTTDQGGAHSHPIRIAGVSFAALAAVSAADPLAAPAVGVIGELVNVAHMDTNDSFLTGLASPSLVGAPGWIARGPNSGSNAGDPAYNFVQTDGQHGHNVNGSSTTGPNPNAASPHSHTLNGSTAMSGNTAPVSGSTPYQARDGKPAYSFIDSMQVKLDGSDITALILRQLGWTSLGDGTATHAFVMSGTGGLDLVQLGLPLGVGPHELEFRLINGGGKVLYNLYVE